MKRDLNIQVGANVNRTLRIQPGGKDEFFYSNSASEPRCIGHMYFDVDPRGKLWLSWRPHQAAQKYNRQPFRDEFDAIMDAINLRAFRNPRQILRALLGLGVPVPEEERRYYDFHIDTDAHSYYFRIFPYTGGYSYCCCYARGGANESMDTNACGKTLSIRGVDYVLLAVRGNDVLMLERKDNGDPCQYVVAHGIHADRDELCWLNGDYFPIERYPDSAAALKAAMEAMA